MPNTLKREDCIFKKLKIVRKVKVILSSLTFLCAIPASFYLLLHLIFIYIRASLVKLVNNTKSRFDPIIVIIFFTSSSIQLLPRLIVLKILLFLFSKKKLMNPTIFAKHLFLNLYKIERFNN